jgi:hypothetical protein
MKVSEDAWNSLQKALDCRDETIREQRAKIDILEKKAERLLDCEELLTRLLVETDFGDTFSEELRHEIELQMRYKDVKS